MNNDQEKWFALEIAADRRAEEAVEFALNELDSIGTEIDSLGKKGAETIEIIGYFNEKPADEAVRNALDYSLKIYGFSNGAVKNFVWREVENRDWLAEWKKHWKATETEKFIIAPPWEKLENTERIVIRIEPQMAFGTGTHETTRLCLRAIEKFYEPEMSFFDLGTGTGILSVAAAKIQGKSKQRKGEILACDTDADSVKIARENARLNDAENIEFFAGSISAETPPFDFVCANVTADVIVPLLPLLIEKTRQILVLSGILVQQERLVTQKLTALGIENFSVETDGEWIGIIVEISNLKSQKTDSNF